MLLQTGRIAQEENFELLLIYLIIISLNVPDITFAYVVSHWFLTVGALVRSGFSPREIITKKIVLGHVYFRFNS